MENINSADYDGLTHHCGLFGIYNHPEAARVTYLGLYALQHRGEESAGIVTSDGNSLYSHKGMGLVGDVFDEDALSKLSGSSAIGHTRYSTTGSSLLKNAQPLLIDYSRGSVAVAHNGNLINAEILRAELEAHGSIFQTTVDSEIILHMLARPYYSSRIDGLIDSIKRIKGAYCLLFLTENELIGVRDPHGFRPLWLGKLNNSYCLASESCALDLIEAQYIREVAPGEVIIIDNKGLKVIEAFGKDIKPSFCMFEHVYFSRPDSIIFGESVHLVRQNLGRNLAKEHPTEADLVMAVPDSGNSAALGFSYESGIPFQIGMTRNHYIGRTFIQPTQHARDFKVRVKFNSLKSVLKDKRIVVVDDSIIRGTTCRARVKNLREAGAKEIHMRISCPPHKFPCFYGIDFPTRSELIANTHTLDEIRRFIHADTLGYLSLNSMLASASLPQDNYCTACWSGRYPVEFGAEGDKYAFEKNKL